MEQRERERERRVGELAGRSRREAASMAAVANLSSFTLGSLLQQQPSGSSGGGKASTQINPSTQFPLLSPVFTCCRASLNYRRNSFVQGGHKVLFMIQKLSSACNCHGRLQHFVCNSVDESSESAASQVFHIFKPGEFLIGIRCMAKGLAEGRFVDDIIMNSKELHE